MSVSPTHPLSKDIPPLKEVIERHGLSARKSLGQNFLLDQNITNKIIRDASAKSGGIDKDCTVIEIGAGPGGLTRSILSTEAQKVIAVEIDTRAINALQELQTYYPQRLEILDHDATRLNWDQILQDSHQFALVGNLPYNVATQILINILHITPQHADKIKFMAFMFQKEVGERICASVKTKSYGRLSILSQWLYHTRKLFDLPASAFTPRPKVASSIIHFTPKIQDNAQDDLAYMQTLEDITAKAFSQRRKMIRSSLKPYCSYFSSLNLNETCRAEDIDIATYIELAKLVSQDNDSQRQ